MERGSPVLMTEFDIATLEDSTQILKALIPYMDFPVQKSMAIIVRLIELMDTVRCYGSGFPVFPDKTKADNEEIMSELSKYCPQYIRQNINMITQMMQLSNMMNLYKDMEQNPEFTNIMNIMKEMQNDNASFEPSYPDEHGGAGVSGDQNADGSFIQGMMNDEQTKLYNDYLEQIDNILSSSFVSSGDEPAGFCGNADGSISEGTSDNITGESDITGNAE